MTAGQGQGVWAWVHVRLKCHNSCRISWQAGRKLVKGCKWLRLHLPKLLLHASGRYTSVCPVCARVCVCSCKPSYITQTMAMCLSNLFARNCYRCRLYVCMLQSLFMQIGINKQARQTSSKAAQIMPQNGAYVSAHCICTIYSLYIYISLYISLLIRASFCSCGSVAAA